MYPNDIDFNSDSCVVLDGRIKCYFAYDGDERIIPVKHVVSN